MNLKIFHCQRGSLAGERRPRTGRYTVLPEEPCLSTAISSLHKGIKLITKVSRSPNAQGLFQRSYGAGWFQSFRPVPRFPQFHLSKRCPFGDQTLCARREMSAQYGQGFYVHQHLVFAVKCVEVRRLMVIKIHAYDDSVETAEFRYLQKGYLRPASFSRRTFRSGAYRGRLGKVQHLFPKLLLRMGLCAPSQNSQNHSRF